MVYGSLLAKKVHNDITIYACRHYALLTFFYAYFANLFQALKHTYISKNVSLVKNDFFFFFRFLTQNQATLLTMFQHLAIFGDVYH